MTWNGFAYTTPSQQGRRRDDCRDLFQDFPAELLRPCCQTATLVVRESHPSVPNLFSKDAIFLGEIFNDMLLVLVYPASDRNDQKREWIQTGVHFRSLARSIWKLFERIGPSESSFWILRGYGPGHPRIRKLNPTFDHSATLLKSPLHS